MLIYPTLDLKEFAVDQTELADSIVDQLKSKIPNIKYEIQGGDIVFLLPNKKVNFPVKVINGRFYTNDRNFEKYISEDRKSIKYAPYSELFETIKLEF